MDQDILDCLDSALAAGRHSARVDTSSLTVARDLVVKFEERAKKIVSSYVQRIPTERRRSVHVFFCENESYGAFVLSDRHDYIVLHIGLVPILLDYCQRMMTVPALWGQICKSKSQLRKRDSGEIGWSNNPACQALGVVFASECFDLIVRHELAHHVLGHCQFKAAHGHRAMIADSDGRVNHGMDPLTAQVLELAADGHSAIYGAESLVRLPRMLGRMPGLVDAAYREFHKAPSTAKINYLLSMFFVFRLMDEVAWNKDDLFRRSHPPAPIRYHAACVHLDEHFRRKGDADAIAQWTAAISQAWDLGEIIFSSALGRRPDHEVKRRTLSEESESHYNKLSEHAKTLPPHLFEITLSVLG